MIGRSTLDSRPAFQPVGRIPGSGDGPMARFLISSSIRVGEGRPRDRHQHRPSTVMALHYPRKTSRIKKIRKSGFRARMATKAGRKIINGRRRDGRKRLTTI